MAFEFHQKVLFKHCDPAGIVFYPRYFEMLNDVVEAFFDHMGFPFEALHVGTAVPAAQMEARFTAPSRHGDRLVFTLRVLKLGRTSLGLGIDAACGGEPRLVSRLTIVHINSKGRPAPWPDDMREAIAQHEEKGG